MKRVDKLETVFLPELPEKLEYGILYVSEECRVALHNCACDCGQEVSTPLGSTEFKLAMHGEGATIYPSIGNHDFACASHYFIRNGSIIWSGRMTRMEIEAGRQRDRLIKRPPVPIAVAEQPSAVPLIRRVFNWLKSFFSGNVE